MKTTKELRYHKAYEHLARMLSYGKITFERFAKKVRWLNKATYGK